MGIHRFRYSRTIIIMIVVLATPILVLFPTWALFFGVRRGPHDGAAIIAMACIFYTIALFWLPTLFRAFGNRNPVVIMDIDGITDTRFCEKAIPWNAISGVVLSTGGRRMPRGVVLNIIPARRKDLQLKGYWADNLPYFNFVLIASGTLEVSTRRLFSLVREAFNHSSSS